MLTTGMVVASVYGVIGVLGLIGNITLIRTFCSTKSIRNVPNLFMSSLALGDVLLLVTCAPVDASRYLTDDWLFGSVGCKVIAFIQLTSVGVSVFTLTALSADRYRAIVKPLDIKTSSSTTVIVLRAALIWLLSMVLALPDAVFSDLRTFVTPTNESFVTCSPYPHAGELHPKISSMASFLVFYVIPLLVISVYYTFIARSLMKSASNLPVEGNLHARRQASGIQEALSQDRTGVCWSLCSVLAALSYYLLVPLLPLLPGGHFPGSPSVQHRRSHPGLYQLLPQPVCPLSAERHLPEAVQPAAVLLLPRDAQTRLAEPHALQHTRDIATQHPSLHGEPEHDQWPAGASGGLRVNCVSVFQGPRFL